MPACPGKAIEMTQNGKDSDLCHKVLTRQRLIACRCMFVPQKPFAAYLERVLASKAGPLEPTPQVCLITHCISCIPSSTWT